MQNQMQWQAVLPQLNAEICRDEKFSEVKGPRKRDENDESDYSRRTCEEADSNAASCSVSTNTYGRFRQIEHLD